MSEHSDTISYSISLDKVSKIALSGIMRASRFAKFAQTGSYDLDKVNAGNDTKKIISHDTVPPIKKVDFIEWQSSFINWNLCNSVNEIVESFLIFLEFVYVALDQHGRNIAIKNGELINKKIKEEQSKIRDELRSKNKLHALREKGVSLSDNENGIIESFAEIRNLLSHNLGIADERKKLQLIDGKIILKWYYPEFFIKLNSGEEIKFEHEPIYCEDGGTVCMRPKAIQQKTINVDLPITFSVIEIYQIAWTFWLLVHNINSKVLAVLNPTTAAFNENTK